MGSWGYGQRYFFFFDPVWVYNLFLIKRIHTYTLQNRVLKNWKIQDLWALSSHETVMGSCQVVVGSLTMRSLLSPSPTP